MPIINFASVQERMQQSEKIRISPNLEIQSLSGWSDCIAWAQPPMRLGFVFYQPATLSHICNTLSPLPNSPEISYLSPKYYEVHNVSKQSVLGHDMAE